MKKTALITGATSGIGLATARLMAKNNFNLILTGRRNIRLLSLQEEIRQNTESKVFLLNFDIINFRETESALNQLPEEWKEIDVLINNAGLALGMNTINEGVIDDWEQMIDTNIKGLLYITKLISSGMVERRSGHIVNISSIAGKETYKMGNVYCASKHAVQSLTQGMRLDLLPYGIKVSSVCPGAVETEFSEVRFKGDKTKAAKVYEGFHPLVAEDIAETILFILTRPKHVNIDDVLIMPTAQALTREFKRDEDY
ncbi:MAG: SDR family NAD(P)-dependent oxidoreductase [Bacteroidales bacterium]|jgi:NADP-dependent 3-hydroxy acid dehydrogenase YdfG|nr:SDR family NAD(P)-dependent oxidoreductase [Bacteroidales bacterium]